MRQRPRLGRTQPLTDLTHRSVIGVTRARACVTAETKSRVRSVRPKSHGEALLREAASAVASRRQQYGAASALFGEVARRWSVTLGHPVTPVQVVLCMIELKLARFASNPRHRDSAVDIAGYVALLDEVI